jgi:hypothetical protein
MVIEAVVTGLKSPVPGFLVAALTVVVLEMLNVLTYRVPPTPVGSVPSSV